MAYPIKCKSGYRRPSNPSRSSSACTTFRPPPLPIPSNARPSQPGRITPRLSCHGESGGIGRYPREVESAVYFCALEALQNVAKYADATSAVVRLGERDGRLEFEIADDGRGFDPTATSYGTGMQGMVDRLDAIGGTLEVSSESGRGTMVLGRITLPG